MNKEILNKIEEIQDHEDMTPDLWCKIETIKRFFQAEKQECPICKGHVGVPGDAGCYKCNGTGKVNKQEDDYKWVCDECSRNCKARGAYAPNMTCAADADGPNWQLINKQVDKKC